MDKAEHPSADLSHPCRPGLAQRDASNVERRGAESVKATTIGGFDAQSATISRVTARLRPSRRAPARFRLESLPIARKVP
jgi:hypothetical protein